VAGRLNWNGARFQEQFRRQIRGRITAACIYLENQVKADVSQPGTLRYTVPTKSGKPSRRQRTVYNFTHSRPGNPPFKQTGHLRRSITHEVDGPVGRVGSNLAYARALELGYAPGGLAPRPFLRSNLVKHMGTIGRIVRGEATPGGLPAVESNQFRSGHFGAGAREAGYE
jgi:phage gpG-like protein